ncbi:MAG TPA: inositol-3-phosphate synthase, partial [Actinomycetota bacterium]|nr:inositol-3-phosphate synthase [Actinomycetota bacterium]
LEDRKWAHIRIEGKSFGEVPLTAELKLEVWDSPNSAGLVIDAVRMAKLALERGIGGPLIGPSAYFMKSPPEQYPDEVARQMVESFIAGEHAASTNGNGNGSRNGNGKVHLDPATLAKLGTHAH